MKGRDFYHNPSNDEMELVSNPSPHVSSSEKNLRTINELKDLRKYQDSTNIHHPSYGIYQEPTVGTTAHRKKYPARYGYNYTSKIDQVIYPIPGTAPSEKKEKMADQWSSPSHRGPSYDHSARTLQQEQELGKKMLLEKQKAEKKLIKFALEESPDPIVKNPVLKKAINDQQLKKNDYDEKKYNIKQRLKNVRGPSTWELITKHANTWQDKQDIRKIVNDNYKRDPSSIFPEDIKWLDQDLKDPVKIPQYPEVVLSSPPEVPRTTINRDNKPVEQIVSELANDRLIREQKDWDRRYGKSGITSLKRPE